MGENAKKGWEWHNNVVGEGYQAKGVVRQRTAEVSSSSASKFIDLSKSTNIIVESDPQIASKYDRNDDHKAAKKDKKRKHKDEKKSKKEKKDKKRKHSKDDNDKTVGQFNPFLQLLASRLSNTTMHFSETN